jgi:hypothetical protein
MVVRKVIKTIFIAPRLYETKVGPLVITLRAPLVLEIDLQTILAIVPGDLTAHAFKSTLFADTVKRLEARGVQRSLEIHVLYMEVQSLATFSSLNCKVEPCSKKGNNC